MAIAGVAEHEYRIDLGTLGNLLSVPRWRARGEGGDGRVRSIKVFRDKDVCEAIIFCHETTIFAIAAADGKDRLVVVNPEFEGQVRLEQLAREYRMREGSRKVGGTERFGDSAAIGE